MNLADRRQARARARFPRACGDEPYNERLVRHGLWRFPRACGDEPGPVSRSSWRLSRFPRACGDEPRVILDTDNDDLVFPAHAGMNRLGWTSFLRLSVFSPRMRG